MKKTIVESVRSSTLERVPYLKKSKSRFDPDKPRTWDTELIEKEWRRHSNDGYQAMVVLTVVTKDTLPPDQSQQSRKQYTLDLQKDLIAHFQGENDKRLKNKTERLAESGAAYVLYLAIKFVPYLVVPLHKLSFSLIDLPNDYYESLWKLVDHIKSIMKANKKVHGGKCKELYIGKSTIREKRRPPFDPYIPRTWDDKLIRGWWCEHSSNKFQAMTVLTVVTEDTLPHLDKRSPNEWKEQYTVALKQALITHFMFVEEEHLAYENTMPGKFAEGDPKAHVLYLAMKFEQGKK